MRLVAMILLRHIITIVCLVATFVANAGEQLTANSKGAAIQPTNAELQLLQGTWEGSGVGANSHEKITVTITGDAFHFHRDTNFWYDTTITLPAGKDPKQFIATIKSCPPKSSIGQVVRAFYKISGGSLTIAAIHDDTEESHKSFDAIVENRYELRKVQPQKQNSQPPKAPTLPGSEPGQRFPFLDFGL